jgi:RimJ/RimL family protein N-acetyltransferase
MTYACLHQQTFMDHAYQILPIRKEDIYLIKEWRNEQIEHLRQPTPLTDEMQKAYFENVIFPSFFQSQPQQILFSFLHNDQLIGYGGIVHLNWQEKQGEVSFLIDTRRGKNHEQYHQDFISFLTLIKKVAFKDLKLRRLFTETYAIRPHHIAILESAGFLKEKHLRNHIKINEKFVDAFIHGCTPHEQLEK